MQKLHSTNNTKSARKQFRSSLAIALGFSRFSPACRFTPVLPADARCPKTGNRRALPASPVLPLTSLTTISTRTNSTWHWFSFFRFDQQSVQHGQEIEAFTKTTTVTASLIYTADTWGVSVMIPYLNRSHGTYGGDNTTYPTLGSSLTTSSDSGIGDVRIIGRFTGLSTDKTSGIIAGIKLPTGSTNKNFDAGQCWRRSGRRTANRYRFH